MTPFRVIEMELRAEKLGQDLCSRFGDDDLPLELGDLVVELEDALDYCWWTVDLNEANWWMRRSHFLMDCLELRLT